ncbi:hypothetical protein K3169_18325 [Pseudomonas phytophila]|uniref:Uncharacterized protein n=1 Tax=Pseudomonas phytophila TaxID=2867264 RepID=A0ABY6F8W8_9PSED|nr:MULTISPECIES: hypothetical protein [Pseudomonas]MCD5980989.1 hypothetical protein [Pseudomonas quasicaspiana]UXZ94319.1 hypothetical protein K3169_18325 [Pseudomonas phytophila]
MQTHSPFYTQVAQQPFVARIDHQFGGDQSPLNDADADEDTDPEAYLDLDVLGLDEFSDSDKLDPIFSSDVGSSSVN